ncbi:MAG: pantetheine-phosphate adenylyltransferase [Thiotrichales bacterium]|nr:MAG: pantetheine-phosphate adenylyltransferase [Thiotrichales bacterium]
MSSTAIYPGSFDPVSNGHFDIIARASKLFDKVVVAVSHNPKKQYLFSLEDRVDMAQEVLQSYNNVSVQSFSDLLVDFVKEHLPCVVIRGIRNAADFEFEMQLANMNRSLCQEVETIFLPTSPENSFVSATLIKDVARMRGDVKRFVPTAVVDKLLSKLHGN